MSKHRYVGGIISATLPTPSQSSASGVWTLDEAQYYQKQGNWPSGSGADPYFYNTTLLLHGDGTNGAQNNTFLDSSTNNFTITRNGNTTQGSFNPYVGPGCWSDFYAPTSSGWQTPANSVTSILGSTFNSTATFTVEAWIYPVARHSGGGAVLGYVFGSLNLAGSNADWSFGPDSNGNLVTFWYQGGNQICKGGSVIPLNTWTHIALSVSGGAIKMFVNGVQETTTGPTTITLATQALNYVSSGGYLYAGTTWQGFNGYISNLRVIAKRAAYTTNFTPSTTPLIATSDTTLLTCQQNGFTDMSGANWTLTKTGNAQISKFSPFTLYQTTPASYSGYFDGTGDYISIPASPAFGFGTGDFTVEWWVYAASLTSGPSIVDLRSGAGASGYSDYITTGGFPALWWHDANRLTSSIAITAGSWNHVAFTRQSGTVRVYVNGVLGGTATAAQDLQASMPCRIGGNITNANMLTGSVSNARITKGFVVYTANFTPSTAPLTATTTVPATQSNSVGFDGTGDYLTFPQSSLQFGNSDFTVEAWVYFSSISTDQYIFNYASSGPTHVGINYYSGAWRIGGFNSYLITGGTASAGQWYHVAMVRSGSILRAYINGTQIGSTVSVSGVTFSASGVGYIGAYYASGSNLNGLVSNLRITNGTAVYTSNFTPPTSALTTTTTVPSNQSNSVSFDGTGDYLTVANNAALNILGGGDFTIEAWVYMSSVPGTQGVIIQSSSVSNGYVFRISSTPQATWVIPGVAAYSFGPTLSANTWYHLAVCREGTVVTGYVNGTQYTFSSTNRTTDATQPTAIGGDNYNLASYLSGFISNLRVTKGQALYTATFTPSTTPLTTTSQGATDTNVSLLTCQDRLLEDNSLNYFRITPSGDARPSSANPFVSTNGIGGTSYSGFFDGTGDYLSVPNNTAFKFGTGDFTVEWWWYLSSAFSSTGGPGIGQKLGQSNGGWVIYRNTVSNTDKISVRLANQGGVTWADYATTVSPTQNTWQHWALVRSGTTLTWYCNGVACGSYTGVSLDITDTDTTAPMYVGFAQTWSYSIQNSSVSNVRVTKGQALYTSNFTPSTSPLTTTSQGATASNVSLLTCQNTTFIDNSTNAFTITVSGNAVTNELNPFSGATTLLTGQSRLLQDNSAIPVAITPVGDARPSSANPFVATNGIGGTSYSGFFDGTGDYLSGPASNSSIWPGSGNFTIEYWLYLPSNPGSTTYYNHFSYGTSGSVLRVFNTGATSKVEVFSGASVILNPAWPGVGQWNHFALVRNGTTLTLYINGVAAQSVTNSTDFSTGTLTIGGEGASNSLLGYVSNFRIVKGTAVYTSNFSPSTTPLTAVSGTQLLTCQSTTFIDNSANAFAIAANGNAVTDESNPFSGATTLLTCQSTTFIDNSAIPLTITANGNATPKRANPFTDTVTGPTPYAAAAYGGSAYFDGTGDYLASPSSGNLAFGTGDFTMEGYFYYNARTQNYPCIFQNSISGSLTANIWGLYYDRSDSAGAFRLYVGNINTVSPVFSVASPYSLYNRWSHIAFVRRSGVFYLFVDGALINTTSNATSLDGGTTETFYVSGPSLATLNAYVSNVRVIKSIAVYTGPFVPPAAPVTPVAGTQLLLNGTNAGIFDNTTVNDLETGGSAQVSTSVVKYGTGSISYPSLGSFLTFKGGNGTYNGANVNGSGIFFAGNTFTIEAWINPITKVTEATYYSIIIGDANTTSGTAMYWNVGLNSSGVPSIAWYDGAAKTAAGTTVIPNNTWTHIAFVVTAGVVKIYVNGVSETLAGTTTITTPSSSLGALVSGVDRQRYWTGNLDDLRVTNGVARYSANFTPPAAAFPNF